MARHLMQPDPDAAGPSLVFAPWLIALALGFVLALSVAAGTH